MKKNNKLFISLVCLNATLIAHADETFYQDGHNYILKSEKSVADKLKLSPSSKKPKNIIEAVEKEKAKNFSSQLKNADNYTVIYREDVNEETSEVTNVSVIYTGHIIVESKDISEVKTSYKLKESFPETGFYIYEIPKTVSVSKALEELSKQPGVKEARVEVIENVAVPK